MVDYMDFVPNTEKVLLIDYMDFVSNTKEEEVPLVVDGTSVYIHLHY